MKVQTKDIINRNIKILKVKKGRVTAIEIDGYRYILDLKNSVNEK